MNRVRRTGKGWTVVAVSLALALAVLLSVPRASAEPGNGKLSRELEEKIHASGPDDLVTVIIQTVGDPTPGHLARLHGRGGAVKARHLSIHGYSARVPASQLRALAEDPEVTHVSSDSPVRAHLDVAIKVVKADQAFIESGGLDGKGVGVAVIDTGVANLLDLQRPRGTPQVVEVEVVGHEPGLADRFGHGSHVAGIIAGNGTMSSGPTSFRTFKGLASGAQIISVRALYPDGTGYTSDILSAIDWVIRFKAAYNIRVINLSLGHPVYESYQTDPICLAVREAYDNGILVVVAAGNYGGVGTGFGTITSPGNEPTALTVGAVDDGNTVTTTDDVLAWYSSKGPSLIDFIVKPDMVAPGTAIVSLRVAGSYLDSNYHSQTLRLSDYRTDPGAGSRDGSYYELSGTSMAAPMVSAAAALLFQKNPALSPATVKARLMTSAAKDDHLVFESGAGMLDVQAALKAEGDTLNAPSPRALLASDGSVQIEDTGLIWGRGYANGLIWGGDRVVRCSPVENNMVTASGLIWGGDRCLFDLNADSIDSLSAIWTTGGKKK